MSQFSSNLVYRMVIDNSQAKRSLAEAQAGVSKATAAFAAQMGSGDGWQKQVGVVTGVLGKLTAVVGVATTFYALGQKIRDVFQSTESSVAAFRDSLISLSSGDKLKATEKELTDLQAKLAASSESMFSTLINSLSGDTSGKLGKKIKALQEDAGRLARDAAGQASIAARKQDEKDRADKAKADKEAAIKARKEAASEFADLEKDAAREAMSARERIVEDALRKIDALNRSSREGMIERERAEAAKANVFDVLRDSLAEYDRAQKEAHEAELKRIKDRADAEVTAAQRAAEAWRRFRDEQIGGQRSTQVGAIPVGIITTPAGGR